MTSSPLSAPPSSIIIKVELRFKIDTVHDITLIKGDVNGDGKADFEIQLTGQHVLDASGFFL
jgi:hypothetical protein